MIPSLGRIVHYVDPKLGDLAAIISFVPERTTNDFHVTLHVLTPDGLRIVIDSPQDCIGKTVGSYHEPERTTPVAPILSRESEVPPVVDRGMAARGSF